MFALSHLGAETLRVSLKCEPRLAEALRAAHPAVIPGYHLNKRHWSTISVLTDDPGALDADEIRDLVEQSYELVRRSLPRAVRPPSIR